LYTLKKLNYLYQDLEPYIDTHTLGLHYNKHYRGYLDKLNGLLLKNHYNFQYPISELYFYLNQFPYEDRQDIVFNLGGVLNHELYFDSLNCNLVKPTLSLEKKINEKYGSYDNFVNLFIAEGMKLKGSGYTFLEVSLNGDLIIMNRSNQDSPIFYGNIPLFCIVFWEHVYYINYENNRNQYLENIFKVVDFSYASNVYEKIKENYV